MTNIWCKEIYDVSLSALCFSGTPFCRSIGWEAQWSGVGALKDNAQLRRLVEMEFAIQPVPLWAQQICRQVDALPFCGFAFPQHIEAVCTNIGHQNAEAINTPRCYTPGPARLTLLADVALLLDGWLKRADPDLVASAIEAKDPAGASWSTVAKNVYQALGDSEPRKILLVRRLLERLRFWLRAPYHWAKTDDNSRLGYLYLPNMTTNEGWDYFGFDRQDPATMELTQRIREQVETSDRWLEVIESTWPCAPKVMRFLERIICTIGRLQPDRSSDYEQLSQSLPLEGNVLPVRGTYLDSVTSRHLYDTSIRVLADHVQRDFPVPVQTPNQIDTEWAHRLRSSLGENTPVQTWLASLLLERIVLYHESFKRFHFTRNTNQRQ